MRIFWPNITLPRGTAYGYHVHIDGMARALRASGVELTEDPSAPSDIAVTITPPNLFAPVPGKRNILFTMAETDSVPPRFAERLKGADVLVVPCRHNVDVFRSVYAGRIEVCPEGIDAEPVPVSRSARRPPRGSRSVSSGADPRTRARAPAFSCMRGNSGPMSGRMPADVQLYMKASGLDVGLEDRGFGVIVDGRNLPGPELAQLYRDAHAFILPSTGEGWALTSLRCHGERGCPRSGLTTAGRATTPTNPPASR